MTTSLILGRERPDHPTFGSVLHAERIKLTSVQSTGWTLAATVILGAGATTLICWDVTTGNVDESPASFITWGMSLAQVCAVVLGALAVTSEYGSGMMRATLAATPMRGRVLAAKVVVLGAVLLLAGTATALLGYVGGNYFLDRAGVGLALEGDVARSMYGSGLFAAGVGVFTAGVGFILRNTAATIAMVFALLVVLNNMVLLIPGEAGKVITQLMPGNAGSVLSTPVPFNPNLLDAWPGSGVFAAETAAIVIVGWVLLRRRDA